MHSLFNLATGLQYGILKFPEWDYVRAGLKRNLDTILRYYNNSPMAVNGDHFLVQLLETIAVPKSQNLQRYYDNVDARTLNLSMALKMTSSVYPGQVFKGVFYGPDTSEILIAHQTPFDAEQANKHWQKVSAVEVLRHPRSDLMMNLPDGTNPGSESGLAVIAINIPLLAIQYRAFRQHEINWSDSLQNPDSQRSLMQFVHMFVLPNMLPSHLDLAIFNRIDNLHKGAPLGESRKRHPFATTDFTRYVNRIQGQILDGLSKVDRDLTGVLKATPAIVKEDMNAVMTIPDVALTRQVHWALSVARFNALNYAFSVAKNGAFTRSRQEINLILRTLLQYQTNNIFRTYLPRDLAFEVQMEIDSIIEKTQRFPNVE